VTLSTTPSLFLFAGGQSVRGFETSAKMSSNWSTRCRLGTGVKTLATLSL